MGTQFAEPPDESELRKGEAMCPPGDDYEPDVDWEGYVENGRDPRVDDRLRMRLPQGDTPGFVLFGSGPELPTPTGIGKVYACVDPQRRWFSGHRYEMLDPVVSEHRLRFKIWQQEPYAPWCELQDPEGPCRYRAAIYDYKCLNMRNEEVDCEVMYLCEHCACDSHGCFAVSDTSDNRDGASAEYARFDLMLDGDRAQGTALNLEPDTGRLQFHATE